MKKELLVKLGVKIRKLRVSIHLSQEDFAEKAGVHRTYIGMVERGEKNITILNLIKISSALGVDLSELLKDL